MPNRRLPKPIWRRYAAAAAGVVVIVGGAAVAVAAGTDRPTNSAGGGARTTFGVTAAATGNSRRAPLTSVQGEETAAPATTTAGTGPTPSATTGTTAGTAATPAAKATLPATVPGPVVTPGRHSGARPGPPRLDLSQVFTGLAFDTCTAPTASTMSAWRAHSPYGAAAVYVGGRNRGCAQPQLTSSWVRTVTTAGWKLIPLYVGAQPPCQTGSSPEKITAAGAASLGASDGADAVAKAAALGMGSGSAIYLDMEAYDTKNTACVSTVLTYVQAWDRALHAHDYLAGFYGFTSSSAAAVAKAKATTADMPDALWYALYDGGADTTTGFPFDVSLWTGHRRGHQYRVNSKETYGGAALTVDRDAWDGPVAIVG